MNNANKIYIDIAPGLSSQVTVRSPQSYWSWFATMHQPLISVNVYNGMRGSWGSVCNTYILCIYGKQVLSNSSYLNVRIAHSKTYRMYLSTKCGATLVPMAEPKFLQLMPHLS